MALCSDRMLSSFLLSSFLSKLSMLSYLALVSILSLICFSAEIRSLRSKFFLISYCERMRYSCSIISLLTVSCTLFQSLLWKSACMFLRRSCRSSPILSFWAINLEMASLSFTCSLPSSSRLDSEVASLDMSLSPSQLSTSLPEEVFCDINIRFFSELESLFSKSWYLLSQFLAMVLMYSDIFSTVSPNLTISMNKTVLFYFSFPSCCIASAPFRQLLSALMALISLAWYCCCLRTSLSTSLRVSRSVLSIVLLSSFGISFITNFSSYLRRTNILVSMFFCRSSQN